jgi:hypothetical protein
VNASKSSSKFCFVLALQLSDKKEDVDHVFPLTLADKPQNRHMHAFIEVCCFGSTFSQIKRCCLAYLSKKQRVSLPSFILGFQQIDVITPDGWFLHVNSVFHDPGKLRDEIIEKAEAVFLRLPNEDTEAIATEFPKFQDAEGNPLIA